MLSQSDPAIKFKAPVSERVLGGVDHHKYMRSDAVAEQDQEDSYYRDKENVNFKARTVP